MARPFGVLAALREEINYPRFWILLCVAFLSLLITTSWDAMYIDDPAWVEADRTRLWFLKTVTWIGFFKEIGFASLIALVLAVFIERSARERQEAVTVAAQKAIAESVYRGVFESDLPKALVDEAIDAVLHATVIRTEHSNTYVLEDKETKVGEEMRQYVEVSITTSYILKNISHQDARVPITIMFSVHASPPLRDLAVLKSMTINDYQLNEQEIEKGNKELPNEMFFKGYRWYRTLKPGQSMTVRSANTLMKDRSDNEIWTSLHPTLNTRLNITMNCIDMEFDADALHRQAINKIEGQGNSGHHSWELTKPVLPHQGIVFWWRPVA